MEQQNTRLRNAGFATFFFSGICAISAGVVVSLLQERYGFAYGMTGTLLSLMSIGNLLAGLLMGMLPSALGMKRSVLLLTIGYAVGYAVMGLTGAVALLAAAFFVVGIAKGSVINTCTILVSDHSADRTRGMNLMHSCYACGALLCPFLIAAAARVSTELAVFLLAAVGLVLWLVYVFTPLRGGKSKSSAEKEAIDWSFLRSARFWLLTGLLFFQNAAEQSVNGWMVTYFKGSGIIAGTLAAYTVTVMWGATLVGRLLIAFVFPLKNPRKAMVGMSVLCTVFYAKEGYLRDLVEDKRTITVTAAGLNIKMDLASSVTVRLGGESISLTKLNSELDYAYGDSQIYVELGYNGSGEVKTITAFWEDARGELVSVDRRADEIEVRVNGSKKTFEISTRAEFVYKLSAAADADDYKRNLRYDEDLYGLQDFLDACSDARDKGTVILETMEGRAM